MVDTNPIVSILVVSYNTRELTLECLRSVREQTNLPYEVIVVDNMSADGSAEAIAEEFPQFLLIAEQENHGFAKGNNIAAMNAKGKYVLLLNPDTVVLDHAIDSLVAFAEQKPKARIWGGGTVYADGKLNPTSCWRHMSLWTIFCRTTGLSGIFPRSEFFNSESYGAWDRGSGRQVDIVAGCFFLMTRADWDVLGGFNEMFFMYGEEADLCLRAKYKLNAAPWVTPEAKIIHYHGASEKVRADKMVRLLTAKITLIEYHFPAWNKPLARGLFRFWPWTRKLLFRSIFFLSRRGEDQATLWSEIWDRRAEWQGGFIPR